MRTARVIVVVVIIVVTVVVRVCVCVPVRSFCRHVHLDPEIIIGKITYVFTAAQKTFLYIIIVILFAQNASFRSYGIICLPRMLLTNPELQNTDTNRNHATWA